MKQRMKTVVADSQYSSRKLRDQASAYGVRAVIHYPANQCRREERLLRVGKYFRTHGLGCDRRVHRQRAAVERLNSRLKEQLSLSRHRAGGLRQIVIHALLYMIALLHTTMAALKLNRVKKAKSINLLAR